MKYLDFGGPDRRYPLNGEGEVCIGVAKSGTISLGAPEFLKTVYARIKPVCKGSSSWELRRSRGAPNISVDDGVRVREISENGTLILLDSQAFSLEFSGKGKLRFKYIDTEKEAQGERDDADFFDEFVRGNGGH